MKASLQADFFFFYSNDQADIKTSSTALEGFRIPLVLYTL